MRRCRIKLIGFAVAVSIGLFSSAAVAVDSVKLITATDSVGIDVHSNGFSLDFAGDVPEDSEVLLKVTGPAERAVLSPQGKHISWSSVETVNVEGMPGFFRVVSSNGFDNLPATVKKSLGVEPGYVSLLKLGKVTIRNDEERVALAESEALPYLKVLAQIRERKDLYGHIPEGIRVNGTVFSGSLHLPPEVPRGNYLLEIYAVRGGEVLGYASHQIQVHNLGLARFISETALYKPELYGLGAVGLALIAGFVVARLFKELNKLLGQDSFSTRH
jgi:hypothetical protein